MAGTRASKKNFNSAVNFFIDITPIATTAQMIGATGEVISGKKAHAEFAEYTAKKIASEMTVEALKNSDRIAHVYSWDKIIEDSTTSYSVDHNDSKPLWVLRNSKRHKGYVIRIDFKKGPDELPVAENIKKMNINDLSRYHFRDQSEQLESVNVIDKSMNVSRTKRRTYTSKWLKKKIKNGSQKRIAMVSSDRVVVLKNFRRKNQFHQEFSKFFLRFWDFSRVSKDSRKTVENMMKYSMDRFLKISKEVRDAGRTDIMRASARISAKSGVRSSVKATITSAPNIMVLYKGMPVASMNNVKFEPDKSNVKQAYDLIVNKGIRNLKIPKPAPGHRVM